ncbi:putative NRPS-like protein biosynthetic cluster [Amphichorda felina]
MSEPTALRPLGALELYSSTRHHIGIYLCVTITARYQLPANTSIADQEAALTAALASVVQDQPLLRVGILKQDTCKPTFSHVAHINLRNHIEWRSSNAQTSDEYEAEVAATQGWLHDQRWPDIETRPPWKIIVIRPADGVFSRPQLDVMFGYHHALADGTGGKEFHQHLLAALKAQGVTPITGDPAIELSFPEVPELPESLEEVIGFKNTYPFLARTLWDMIAPSFLKSRKALPWTANPICLTNPYKTRVRPLDLDSDILQSLIAASRDNSTTLTGLLHALILTSLSRRLPADQASSFSSTTPINLRPWLSPSANPALKAKLRALVTTAQTSHPAPVVAALRDPSATDQLIWQSARRLRQDLTQSTATLPVDDVAGLLPLIPDMFAFWRSKEGKPRGATWEVSNLGVLRQAGGGGDGDRDAGCWSITRSLFTNGAMVAGPAIGLNAISVEGAGLTVAVTWQEGDVEEELVEGVGSDALAFAKRWYETGKFLE